LRKNKTKASGQAKWASFGAAVAGGFASAAIATGSLKAGLWGAVSAAVFWGIGTAFSELQYAGPKPGANNLVEAVFKRASSGNAVAKIAAHAVAGGTLTELQGGKFGHGLVAAGFTEALSPAVGQIEGTRFGKVLSRTAVSAAIGGTASTLSGGSFANGAQTGAFQELFNRTVHEVRRRQTRGPDLNLDPPGSSEFKADNRMRNDPDVFEIAAHGNSQGIEDARTEARPQINAEQIASLVEAHPVWAEGMTVKLYVCSTGAGINPVA